MKWLLALLLSFVLLPAKCQYFDGPDRDSFLYQQFLTAQTRALTRALDEACDNQAESRLQALIESWRTLPGTIGFASRSWTRFIA